MIVEIAIGAAVVAASSIATRILWARRAARARDAAAAAALASVPRGPGLYPGDVLLVAGTELALDRASELEDGVFVRILETISSEPRFLVQLDRGGEHLVLASPRTGLPEGRVADIVEMDGRTLTLVRRGIAVARTVVADGEGLLAGRAAFTILADRGGRHLVVLEPEGGARLVLLGDLLDRRLVDLLPGR